MNAPKQVLPNLVFLTPLHRDGAVSEALYVAMPSLRARLGAYAIRSIPKTQRSGPLPQARAELAAWYLDSGIEHGIFLDADVRPEPEHVHAMLAVDSDVVCVPYVGRPRDTEAGSWWTCWARQPLEVRESAGHRLVTLDGTGMGLVRITRGALEAMGRAYPDLWGWSTMLKRAAGACFLWNEGLRDLGDGCGPQYEYEDRSFCWRARRCGLRVEALCDMQASHDGRVAPESYATFLGLPKRETEAR